ncbi:MAG: barstar family protein [Lachnospiraceae bacterium]|nr:barstar family protein [Lachnospiraceae bacterium]
MSDRKAAHAYIAETLGFPDYYGNNLDALFDCLTDMKACDIKFMNSEGLDQLGEYAMALRAVFDQAALVNERIKVITE